MVAPLKVSKSSLRAGKKVGGETCRLLNDDEPLPAPRISERGAGSLNMSEYYEPVLTMPNMTVSFASTPSGALY